MLTREVQLLPAYDKRPEYGVHCVELRMVLTGTKGVVQFVLYTGWYLPENKETSERLGSIFNGRPMPAELGYHARKPVRDWQKKDEPSFGSCEYLDGDPCWYDGSGLNAERVYQLLLKGGSDAVWEELESYYEAVFGTEEGE